MKGKDKGGGRGRAAAGGGVVADSVSTPGPGGPGAPGQDTSVRNDPLAPSQWLMKLRGGVTVDAPGEVTRSEKKKIKMDAPSNIKLAAKPWREVSRQPQGAYDSRVCNMAIRQELPATCGVNRIRATKSPQLTVCEARRRRLVPCQQLTTCLKLCRRRTR